MRLYLATWPEGWGDSQNPQSRLRSGTVQWEAMTRIYGVASSAVTVEENAMSVPARALALTKDNMDIYLTDHDPQHHRWPNDGAPGLRLRVLLSYHYYKDVDLEALLEKYFPGNYPDIFADSGAFSAMTQGAEIGVEEYADWLHRYKHLFTAYSNLDVIKNAEATWENQRQLESMDLEPVPVFHVLEDWSWLERYVEEYHYIALGVAGMQARGDAIMAWLAQCFRIGGSRVVFHGFGLTSWKVMSSFPWYSVDSSSWGQGFRYGRVPLFDARRGQFHKLRLGSREDWLRHANLVQELGFEPLDFADRSRNDRAKICALSALSYMRAEQWLRQHHGEIHIPGESGPSGPKAHLVVGAGTPDAPKSGNMSITALAQAGLGEAGPRLHLADTSSGVNFRDAAAGTKVFLTEIMSDLKDVRAIKTDRL